MQNLLQRINEELQKQQEAKKFSEEKVKSPLRHGLKNTKQNDSKALKEVAGLAQRIIILGTLRCHRTQ